MKVSRFLYRTIALVGLSALGAGAANAQGLSISFLGVAAGNGTNGAPVGQFVWDYHLDLSPNTGLRTQEPSSVTFYDFNGITGASFVKATSGAFFAAGPATTFTAGTQAIGITPAGASPLFGDTNALNAVYRYTGPTSFSNPPAGGTVAIGEALIASSLGTTNGAFVGFAAGSLDSQFGNAHADVGAVLGPNVAPAGTPEPGTWAMFVGMGVSGLALARRRKRSK